MLGMIILVVIIAGIIGVINFGINFAVDKTFDKTEDFIRNRKIDRDRRNGKYDEVENLSDRFN